MEKNLSNSPDKSIEEKLNFIHPEKISKYLNCIICQDLFKDPVRLACGYF